MTWEEFIEQQYGRRLPKAEEARIRKLLEEGGVTYLTKKELKARRIPKVKVKDRVRKDKDDAKAVALLLLIVTVITVGSIYYTKSKLY